MDELTPYRRYFRACRWVGVLISPRWLLYWVARLWLVRLHPDRPRRDAWTDAWRRAGVALPDPQAAWQRYLLNGCLATVLLYRRQPLAAPMIRVDPHSQEALRALGREGGLVMTYHHHFAYHCCMVAGSAGRPVHTITLSPRSSPLWPLYDDYAGEWFDHGRRDFAGGDWVFTDVGGSSVPMMRRAVEAVRRQEVLCVAVDIHSPYTSGKVQRSPFLNGYLECPAGGVELACRSNSPLYMAWMTWHGGDGPRFHLQPLKPSHGSLTLEMALDAYLRHLESLLQRDPAFWEAWGLLQGMPEATKS